MNIDLQNGILLIIKIFALFGMSVYSIFALVVVKQVNHMTDTLEVGFETPLRIIAFAHFLLALGVLVAVLVLL